MQIAKIVVPNKKGCHKQRTVGPALLGLKIMDSMTNYDAS